MSESWTLVVNFDWGRQDHAFGDVSASSASWNGLAGYITYAASERWKTSLRAEYFDDTAGYCTGIPQSWQEVTLTEAYLPIKNIEVRAEVRADGSNAQSFADSNGPPNSRQQSVALDLLIKY